MSLWDKMKYVGSELKKKNGAGVDPKNQLTSFSDSLNRGMEVALTKGWPEMKFERFDVPVGDNDKDKKSWADVHEVLTGYGSFFSNQTPLVLERLKITPDGTVASEERLIGELRLGCLKQNATILTRAVEKGVIQQYDVVAGEPFFVGFSTNTVLGQDDTREGLVGMLAFRRSATGGGDAGIEIWSLKRATTESRGEQSIKEKIDLKLEPMDMQPDGENPDETIRMGEVTFDKKIVNPGEIGAKLGNWSGRGRTMSVFEGPTTDNMILDERCKPELVYDLSTHPMGNDLLVSFKVPAGKTLTINRDGQIQRLTAPVLHENSRTGEMALVFRRSDKFRAFLFKRLDRDGDK